MSNDAPCDAPDFSESRQEVTAQSQVPPEYYDKYKQAVYMNLFRGSLYGAYVIVYVTSVYVLLSKPGLTSSPPRIFMFGITTFMFALGNIALVLETTLEFQIAKSISGYDTYGTYYYVWAAITCLMYVLSDAICAWRTVVLWRNDKRVIAILVFFILGTTAASMNSIVKHTIPQGGRPQVRNLPSGRLGFVGPTMATNLLSTGLIAVKAWQRRIPVKGHLREGSGFVRVDRVFALLIESGIIYCCIWILYWISTFGVFPDPGFTTMVFVSGSYPTLIIILVSKQMSPIEQYSTDFTEPIDSEIPFTPRDGSTTRHGP